MGYIHKAVEGSQAKVKRRATSEPRKIYIVLRDRIASSTRECNREKSNGTQNRDNISEILEIRKIGAVRLKMVSVNLFILTPQWRV
jgi:hypothetical protein